MATHPKTNTLRKNRLKVVLVFGAINWWVWRHSETSLSAGTRVMRTCVQVWRNLLVKQRSVHRIGSPTRHSITFNSIVREVVVVPAAMPREVCRINDIGFLGGFDMTIRKKKIYAVVVPVGRPFR